MNCPNNGIIIAADNVTLDLNGHTIDGNRRLDKSCDPRKHFCDIGVGFTRHHGVTVKGGSIRQFAAGVLVFRARHNRLLRLQTRRNRFSGIGVAASRYILVRNSAGNGSTDADGEGIGIFQSHRVRVLDSTFKNNKHVGIKPVGSVHGLFEGNLMARNGDEGLLMEGGAGFGIRHNRVVRNGGGIALGPGSENVIAGNRIVRVADGIRIEDGHDNLVKHNVVVRGRRSGIRLGITHPKAGGARNLVRRNVVRHIRGDGFRVDKKDRRSVLRANVARQATQDGFDVDGRFTTVARNLAVNNGDFGIEAAASAIDAGGNTARGNGHSPQCLHVVCR